MKRIFIMMSILFVMLAFGRVNLTKGGAVRLSPRLLNYQGVDIELFQTDDRPIVVRPVDRK